MQVTAEQAKNMVDYVEKAQPIIEKAAETEKKIAELAPTVVDALIEKGALDANDRDRAIVNIQNPVKALESMKKLAATVGQVPKAPAVEPMGTSENEKTAASNQSSEMSEADRRFFQAFGL